MLKCLQAISGAEKGERAALLLSPNCSFPIGSSDVSRHSVGSLFTIFLTAPLQAFCLLLDISGSDIEMVRKKSSTFFSFYLFGILTARKIPGHI